MKSKNNLVFTLVLCLLGLFMGALNTGIVIPARNIIQNSLGVSDTTGIWMITIFSLAYAVSMPLAGKMADKHGRKIVYIMSITLFGFGSLLCGLSSHFQSFSFLLGARVIQALGGGGIMPIAVAEVGCSFPEEKKGTALGLVGGVYGIANIFGSTIGSSILSIAGNDQWQWLFYINIPISICIIIIAIFKFPYHNKANEIMRTDIKGAVILSAVILSLMYGLTNIKFYDFKNSLMSMNVWPFILLFIVLLPILILVESKAEDPVLNLKYFTNRQVLLTFIISFIVGVGMMGVVFVPQFAENVLKIKTGTGGYLVALLGVFSGIAAPASGKLIDKFGCKIVLTAGFLFTMIGSLFLAFVATAYGNLITVSAGLLLMGFGMGFTMGTPLNYMILTNVAETESSSAHSTLSLIRSIGTTISPNLMVGFIAKAGKSMPEKLMGVIKQIMASKAGGMGEMKGMMTNQNAMMPGNGGIPADAIKNLQTADVFSIVDKLKESMQGQKILIEKIESSRKTIEEVFQSTLNNGFKSMFIMVAIVAVAGIVATLIYKSKSSASNEKKANVNELSEMSTETI